MLTQNQVEKHDRFHKDGCRVTISTSGVTNHIVNVYYKTSKVYIDSARKGTWHVSLKKSDQTRPTVYGGQFIEDFHLPSQCPLNSAVYTVKGLQLVLCKGHADVKQNDLGLEVERGIPSPKKCIECELIEKKDEEGTNLELLSMKTLLESLDSREKRSVRFGSWEPVGNGSSLYEFTPWEKVSSYTDGELSFAQFGEQRMAPEVLVKVDSNFRKSSYIGLIETALNEYLKTHKDEF